MAVVESGGRLAQIEAPWAPSLGYARGSVRLYGEWAQDYAAIYRTQPAVRTVVSFLARNIAQLGLKVFRRIDDDTRAHAGDHPAARALRRPNIYTTRYGLIHGMVSDLAIYDECYVAKLRSRDGDERRALVRLPAQLMHPTGRSFLFPQGFELRAGRAEMSFAREEIIYIHGYDPEDPRRGLPALETLRRIIAEDAAAGEYREHYWRNAARVEGVIERPAEAPKWSTEARAAFRAQWEELYSGAGGSGKTAVLEEGMAFKPAAFSARDAQYVEARKFTREEVCNAYHIPPPMVGILDKASFSNITEQHKMLYQDTLGPWLAMIEEELELQLLAAEFGAEAEDFYVEFNLAEKLKGSFEEQAQALQTSVGAPWLTRNEARARQNLPPLDGGDEIVTPLNVLIGGQASPTDATPDGALAAAIGTAVLGALRGKTHVRPAKAPRALKAGDDAEETPVAEHAAAMQAFFERQARAVASKLGAAKARKAEVDDLFDEDRWNDELAADLLPLAVRAAGRRGQAVYDALEVDEEYDPEDVTEWLTVNSRIAAENINATTRDQLAAALGADDVADAVRNLFMIAVASRAAQIAQTRVTQVEGFAGTEAARSAGAGTKTWIVTSSNSRHPEMDGETVPIGESFSNGADWPGDPSLGAEQTAGCTCLVEFAKEGP